MTETLIPPISTDDALDQQAHLYEQVVALSKEIESRLSDARQTLNKAQTALEQEDYFAEQALYESVCQALLEAEKNYLQVEAMDPANLFRHARELRAQTLTQKPELLKLLDQAEGMFYQAAQLVARFDAAQDAEQKGDWDVFLHLVESALEIHPESIKFSELRNKHQDKQTTQPESRLTTMKSWLKGNFPWLFVFVGFACHAILLAGWLVVSTK